MKVSGQLHAPAALPPREELPVHIGEEVGWTREPVWTTWRKFLTLPGLERNITTILIVIIITHTLYPHYTLNISKFKVTLQLAVYRHSVCLGVKPLDTHDQRFFSPN
jgi:hypothetical protein